MEALKLQAKKRTELGKQVRALRRSGYIPAVVYGRGVTSQALSVLRREFERFYRTAGESRLIDLVVADDKPLKALIQDIARDPLTGAAVHIDFRVVTMTEKLRTEIELRFVGRSRAVAELGGVLVKNMSKVKIECLPDALVDAIEVDLAPLAEFGTSIQVKDLVVPPGITLLEHAADGVATVIAPRSEEELAALDQKVEEKIEEVKVESEEKKAAKAAEEPEAAEKDKKEKK